MVIVIWRKGRRGHKVTHEQWPLRPRMESDAHWFVSKSVLLATSLTDTAEFFLLLLLWSEAGERPGVPQSGLLGL